MYRKTIIIIKRLQEIISLGFLFLFCKYPKLSDLWRAAFILVEKHCSEVFWLVYALF